jgi:hypothetical protein
MPSPPKLLGLLSVVALCAGPTPALAQTSISLTQVAPASLRLRFEHPTTLAGRVQVVRLHGGQTLFTEPYTGPAYGHRFDFDHVPSGRYLVWIQAGDQVQRCLVWVQTQEQGSVIRRIKLASDTMPTAVLVKSWQSAPSSGMVAAGAARNPMTPAQGPR